VTEHDGTRLGRRLSSGDSSVLELILRTYGPAVGGWLRHKYAGKLGSEDIRDILACSLWKLWRERERYDPSKSSLRSFFFLIARCEAVDMLRQGSRVSEILLGDEAASIAAREPAARSASDPEDRGRSQEIQDLNQCMSNLNESSRYILWADACSHGEVVPSEILARELDMSESAVRVARKRGLDKLRSGMKELGY
jgi:RNA polymerase sigma factor (sigma-70 family)